MYCRDFKKGPIKTTNLFFHPLFIKHGLTDGNNEQQRERGDHWSSGPGPALRQAEPCSCCSYGAGSEPDKS